MSTIDEIRPAEPTEERRPHARASAAALPAGLLPFLAACGAGTTPADGSDPAFAVAGVSTTAVDSPQTRAARFLLHAQFGASYAEIAEVERMGAEAWLDAQMALPSSTGGWEWLKAQGYDAVDQNQFFSAEYLTDYMVWYQLMASPDQVRRRMALALSEFFVVSAQGIALNWPAFAMARYWDILCAQAFGNFRQLLEDVTLSHAMGAFLNTLGNQKEDPATGRQPDENYAREVMQLFTVGLSMLEIDGTPKRGADGQPIETFTQSDVSNLARVFTGWDIATVVPPIVSPVPPYPTLRALEDMRRPMALNESLHSRSSKTFLGTTIPAGTGGRESLRIALDTLFEHPNVGPFFGRQMIQRLVCSDPSPGYVARVARVFDDNGRGVRGDLAAVFRAILLDEEATGDASLASATFGKLREPMVRVAQWAHTFEATSRRGTWKMSAPIWSSLDSLAQSPLQAPSAFNFFRPGHVPSLPGLASRGATAPEFQIVNESTVCSYLNFLRNIAHVGIWVRAPERRGTPTEPTPTDAHDIAADYATEMSLATDPVLLVQHLNLLLCAGQLSTATVGRIVAALRADPLDAGATAERRRLQVARALMFVMGGAEYLVQR